MSYADIKGMKLALTDYGNQFDSLNKVLINFLSTLLYLSFYFDS